MREAIKELSNILTEHFDSPKRQDVTVVLNTVDTLELVQNMDVSRYDEVCTNFEGEYHYVSSQVGGDFGTTFFVENVKTEDGHLKYDETDILIISSYMKDDVEVFNHLLENGYGRVIELDEDSTYETLVEKIEC
jgi:hypothetical protein